MKVNIAKKFFWIEQYRVVVKMTFIIMLLGTASAYGQVVNEREQGAVPNIKVGFFEGEDVIMIDVYGVDNQDVVVRIFNNEEKEVYSKSMFLRKGASIVTPLNEVKDSPKYVVKLITKEGVLTSEFSKKR